MFEFHGCSHLLPLQVMKPLQNPKERFGALLSWYPCACQCGESGVPRESTEAPLLTQILSYASPICS